LNRADYTSAIMTWFGAIDEKSHLAVTLTMKQSVRHQKLDKYLATRNMRHFLNNLNRSIFGNASKRFGKKIEVIAVQETSNWQRLHYHLLIKVPDRISIDEFSNLILQHWKSTDFAYNENTIRTCHSSGWISYMLKNTKTTAEIDIENTNIGR